MSSAAAIAEPRTVDATWIEQVTYEWLMEPEAPRVMVHEGGTRSGKTYNLCIGWTEYLLEVENELLSIVRATGPAMKRSVQRDLVEVLRSFGVYSDDVHNKTENLITLPSGSQIELFSAEDAQKIHGPTRHHLWCNEANEIGAETYRQLLLRTKRRVVLDFNPSFDAEHWIWQRYEFSDDAIWYRSTYLDNPYISDEQRREIEALKVSDPWAWQVYGLGMRGVPATAIYRGVEALLEWPDHADSVLGLDFGYNDAMSLNRVARRDGEPLSELLVWALVHESFLTTDDLIDKLPELGVAKRDVIYCDGAEPDRIETIRRAGYSAVAADKSKGSRRAGIDFCKQHRIRVGGPAGDRAKRELRAYRWKEDVHSGRVLDEPIDRDDHAPDSVRYAAFTHWGKARSLVGASTIYI